jgi:threonyl-tRNA synthetase
VWLAPEQVIVLPITDRNTAYAAKVRDKLVEAGLRAKMDDRSEKVNLKIREAQLMKIPYMLVVGDREEQNGAVAVRNRKHGDLGAKPLDEFIADITKLVETKAPSE